MYDLLFDHEIIIIMTPFYSYMYVQCKKWFTTPIQVSNHLVFLKSCSLRLWSCTLNIRQLINMFVKSSFTQNGYLLDTVADVNILL